MSRNCSVTEQPFNFDLERMQRALEGGVVSFPRGLGNARQQFLRDDNKHTGFDFHPSQYIGCEVVRGLVMG